MDPTGRMLLSGNEAVARAARDAAVAFAAGYPGTPSTEILERFSELGGHAEWAPNEKVALEVALGAAFGGARAMATMKHVGLNVAADPLFTAAYTGVSGALIVVSADDPGMASSQNEQDNRHYARAAGVPMLEPSDSQEAYDFTLAAIEISERWRLPVLLRLTTRVCHSKTVVLPFPPEGFTPSGGYAGKSEADDAAESPPDGVKPSGGGAEGAKPSGGGLRPSPAPRFERDVQGRVMIPTHARLAHRRLREKLAQIAEWNETSPLSRLVEGDGSPGIIASGISYVHAREAAPKASVLKIGLTYPLPLQKIRGFAGGVARCVVIEEGDPYLADSIRAAGIAVEGKPERYRFGELDVARVRRILAGDTSPEPGPPPGKAPELCVGCPHRVVFEILRDRDCIVAGDIGCYTLGVLPPFQAMDSCVCMGAAIGVGLGLRHVLPDGEARRVVSVLGDSTFVHSGLTGLVEMVYNPPKTGHVLIILDNGTTAMTGHQEHPGTGRTLDRQPTGRVVFEDLARALGVRRVHVIDVVQDRAGFERALTEGLASGELAVLIVRRPCLLVAKAVETA